MDNFDPEIWKYVGTGVSSYSNSSKFHFVLYNVEEKQFCLACKWHSSSTFDVKYLLIDIEDPRFKGIHHLCNHCKRIYDKYNLSKLSQLKIPFYEDRRYTMILTVDLIDILINPKDPDLRDLINQYSLRKL